MFSAIILVLCAGISSHLCFGFSTRQSRETFIGLIFLIMIGYQFFHLIRAALFIPATPFTIFNQHLHRSDCLNSGKGMTIRQHHDNDYYLSSVSMYTMTMTAASLQVAVFICTFYYLSFYLPLFL